MYNTNAGATHAAARRRELLAEARRDARLALARSARSRPAAAPKTLPARAVAGRVLRFWVGPDAIEPAAA